MRVEKITVYENHIINIIAGQLFEQSPDREPRKAEIIMKSFRDKFREKANNINEIYSVEIEKNKLYNYIKDILFSIEEFEDLNLSHIEWHNNVSVDDPNRFKYGFVTTLDKNTRESWKGDFVDLVAFVRNVYNKLTYKIIEDKDCGTCKNLNTTECAACKLNPKFTINYQGSRRPNNEYTFSCKYNCYKSYMICCEECEQEKSCNHRCFSISKNCGNKVTE